METLFAAPSPSLGPSTRLGRYSMTPASLNPEERAPLLSPHVFPPLLLGGPRLCPLAGRHNPHLSRLSPQRGSFARATRGNLGNKTLWSANVPGTGSLSSVPPPLPTTGLHCL